MHFLEISWHFFCKFWQFLTILTKFGDFLGKILSIFWSFLTWYSRKIGKNAKKFPKIFFFFPKFFFFYFFKISFYSRKSYKKFLFFVTFFLKNFWKISKKNFFAFFCKSCYSPEFAKCRNFEKKNFRKNFAFFFIPTFLQFFWKIF